MNEKVTLLKALAKAPLSAKTLAQNTKKPLSTTYRNLKQLAKEGLITQNGYAGPYQINQEQKKQILKTIGGIKNEKLARLPIKGFRAHALSVKFVLKAPLTAHPSFWDKHEQLKGWTRFKKRLANDVLLIASHKSLIIHFPVRHIDFSLAAFDKLRLERLNLAFRLERDLALRGIIFDASTGHIINQETASNLEDALEAAVPRDARETVLFNRKVSGSWPSSLEAKAWIDASAGLEVETNDDLEVRRWLLLPSRVDELAGKMIVNNDLIAQYRADIALYSEQIRAHLAAVQAMSKAMQDIRELVKK